MKIDDTAKWCINNSIILTDWKTYNCLKDEIYQLLIINNFRDGNQKKNVYIYIKYLIKCINIHRNFYDNFK